MRGSKALCVAALLSGGASTFATQAHAQALHERVVERFDAVANAVFVNGDWNPADGDTTWLTHVVSSSASSANPYELDFAGPAVMSTFRVSDDPWENVSVKSTPGQVPSLVGTQELQLLLRPSYQTDKAFVSVVLRLTMQDGSLWDSTKVLLNNVWQRAAYPVGDGAFARVQWGPEGAFDLSSVASWEVLFVDLPAGQHAVELYALYAKSSDVSTSLADAGAEPFDARFYTVGGTLDTAEASVLFRHGDWNPSDGDTDWLYHRQKYATQYSATSFLHTAYRSDGDPWETVSIRKDATARFDLGSAKQVVAYLNAESNADPNALVLSLTMRDGSVWQQGTALDVVSNLGYVSGNRVGTPYRFSLDASGAGFTRAAWGPAGQFSLDEVRSWELFFNNLRRGVHSLVIEGVETRAVPSLVASATRFDELGQARWLSQSLSTTDMHATVSSDGEPTSGVSIAGEASAANGFVVEVGSSYANTAVDAAVFRLIGTDGEVRQVSFALPQPGRSIMRVHTTCPALPAGVMARGAAEMDARCRGLQGEFYGMDLSKFTRWELLVTGMPTGEHELTVAVYPQLD